MTQDVIGADSKANNDAEKELSDILPALKLYKENHTIINLQKLCAEVSEFCAAIFASTKSNAERDVYRDMARRLKR